MEDNDVDGEDLGLQRKNKMNVSETGGWTLNKYKDG